MGNEVRTRVLPAAEGREEWRLTRCRLKVRSGPDKGRSFEMRDHVSVGTDESCDLVLTDPTVSRRQFEIVADDRGFLLRDTGSTNGTRVEGLLAREVYLAPGARIGAGATEIRFAATDEEQSLPLSQVHRVGSLLGRSRAMRHLFALLERVAPSDLTVLIEGESGTGKELVARELHQASARREAPLITVDGGAIPRTLIESELFGHEKGAFTGADSAHAGAFEEANTGTIFLDEIGELPLEMQTKLLRVLEQREVKRLGSHVSVPVDVRVVAATNRNLEEETRAGRFRQDLFFRLAVCRLWVPPLRQRLDDIELLARHFVARSSVRRDPEEVLTPALLEALRRYDWPGNVRELRNVVERLVLFPELRAEAIGPRAGASAGNAWREELAQLPYHEARQKVLDEFERGYVGALIESAGGVVSHAATKAGLPRQTFHKFLRRHGLRGD
jgi:two-component system, NtrC family, response regulator GlrR